MTYRSVGVGWVARTALAALALWGGGAAEATAGGLSVSLAGVRSEDTLSGRVPVEAKVTGDGVARVEFRVDGRLVRTELRAPYCMVRDAGRCPGFDTGQLVEGRHTITATAYDRAGRSATASAEVTVRNGRSDGGGSGGGSDMSGSSGGRRLQVMSYNINWGAPSGHRLEGIAKVIASSGADVAGLQQVRRFTGPAKKGNYRCEDQPKRLEQALERLTGEDWHSTFAANTNFKQRAGQCIHVTSTPRQEGVAILSRYPIVGVTSYRLPYERSLVKAVVDVPGAGHVAVYTVHLDTFSVGKRVSQARRVADIVKAGGVTAAFLTGDLNDQPGDPPIRILTSVMKDAGGGATRNSKIDYVMYRGDADFKSVRVIQSSASDHRPIVGTFHIN